MEEYENIVTLSAEDGSEVEFEILDIVPYNGSDYAVLLPVDDDSESPECVILEVLPSGDNTEDDMLQGVEDEAILNAVFALFEERNQDLFQ